MLTHASLVRVDVGFFFNNVQQVDAAGGGVKGGVVMAVEDEAGREVVDKTETFIN